MLKKNRKGFRRRERSKIGKDCQLKPGSHTLSLVHTQSYCSNSGIGNSRWVIEVCRQQMCSHRNVKLSYRWRYYSLQYLAIIYNGNYRSGISPGKMKKMAAACDDFWVIFGDRNYPSGISPVKMKKIAAGCDDCWVIFG